MREEEKITNISTVFMLRTKRLSLTNTGPYGPMLFCV